MRVSVFLFVSCSVLRFVLLLFRSSLFSNLDHRFSFLFFFPLPFFFVRKTNSYHGFQFAFDGACTSVPQAISAKAEQKAKASPRACAAVHPIKHSGDGLLWVWPVAGDFVRAGATPTGEHALLDKAFPEAMATFDEGSRKRKRSEVVFMSPWFVRDVPFDVDVLVENVVDPSHVSFSVRVLVFFFCLIAFSPSSPHEALLNFFWRRKK